MDGRRPCGKLRRAGAQQRLCLRRWHSNDEQLVEKLFGPGAAAFPSLAGDSKRGDVSVVEVGGESADALQPFYRRVVPRVRIAGQPDSAKSTPTRVTGLGAPAGMGNRGDAVVDRTLSAQLGGIVRFAVQDTAALLQSVRKPFDFGGP